MSGQPLEERIQQAWLRDILAAWRNWHGDDGRVRRAAIDPTVLPPTSLQFLFLYERLGNRWHCALSGSGIGQRAGYDPTRRYLDEMLSGNALATRDALFSEVLERGLACVYSGWLAVQERPFVRFERLLLPVVGRGGVQLDTLFGAVAFVTDDGSGRRAPSDVSQPDAIFWDGL
jgi:hypothetical protein